MICNHRKHSMGNCMLRMTVMLMFFSVLIGGVRAADGPQKAGAADAADVGSRVDPPFWWTGMQNERLQLLVHHPGIADYTFSLRANGVQTDVVVRTSNPNYVFIYLHIERQAPAQSMQLQFQANGQTITMDYELRERKPEPERGLNGSDLIYLLMPDRFANGDTTNDRIEGMLDQHLGDDVGWYRKGGDLTGVTAHLDYLQDLSVSTLWLNPVLENDQPLWSYHGYAATDHYRIDPRFGSLDDYLQLCENVHERGMKMVLDLVHNHVGDRHWFFEDQPMLSWFHRWDEFTQTTYRAPSLFDPHASKADTKKMLDGWFVRHMPDLDQTNVLLADYLIQNNIWWIELAEIEALRMDTWAYNDRAFLERWTREILDQFPDLTIFAETWVHGAATQAYFHGNTNIDKDFQATGVHLTDFQLYYAINEALEQEQSWTGGVARLYFTLAKDYLYKSPEKNIIFLDNHDLTRFPTAVKGHPEKMRTGVNFLMTMRGIPSVYYGGEMDFFGSTSPTDANVRKPFPGGWPSDSLNKFEESGRTQSEQEALHYFRGIAKWRSENPVVSYGHMTQFVPESGLYVYFRHIENQAVMVVANCSSGRQDMAPERFDEILNGRRTGTDVVSGVDYSLDRLMLEPWQSLVLEIRD